MKEQLNGLADDSETRKRQIVEAERKLQRAQEQFDSLPKQEHHPRLEPLRKEIRDLDMDQRSGALCAALRSWAAWQLSCPAAGGWR